MKKRSIASNYVYNLIYQLIIVLIPLFTTPYLTRVLGADKLGIYSYTYSIVTIFFLIAALGINTYGQREIAYVQDNKKKRSIVFWELFIIRIISTIFSSFLLLIFSYTTAKYSIYYKIFLIYVFANMFDITWLYQGIEDFKAVAIRNLVIKIIYFISIFILIKNTHDLGTYIFLYSISTLLTNFSFWINIQKVVEKPDRKALNIKKHLKSVLSFFIPQVASLIYTVLDKTMIGIIVPNISNVSFYEQASYIDKTILMLITTAGTVMISKMSYAFEKKDYSKVREYILKIINFVWFLGCALSFGICAIIKNLVPWFYGTSYLPVINLVYVMSPLIIIIGLNNVIGIQYLIPTKQQNKYIFAVICGAILNMILNIILISLLGAIGAGISSVLAELLILLIELYYVKDTINLLEIIKPAWKYLIFGSIMFLITFLTGNLLQPTIFTTILQVIIGIAIYSILLLVTKDRFLKENLLIYLNKLKKAK